MPVLFLLAIGHAQVSICSLPLCLPLYARCALQLRVFCHWQLQVAASLRHTRWRPAEDRSNSVEDDLAVYECHNPRAALPCGCLLRRLTSTGCWRRSAELITSGSDCKPLGIASERTSWAGSERSPSSLAASASIGTLVISMRRRRQSSIANARLVMQAREFRIRCRRDVKLNDVDRLQREHNHRVIARDGHGRQHAHASSQVRYRWAANLKRARTRR